MTQEVVVAAPVEAVWQALTTSAGWESWAVPFAEVEFRVGGVIESSYRLNAAAGDAGNIHNRILSFLPHRMLSIQAVKAPPGFAHADLLGDLHSCSSSPLRVKVERRSSSRAWGIGIRPVLGR